MKAKGFTLVEALVSLMISVTVLGAGIQSSRSGLRATQVASDQLLMSGLADEVVADLTVLRYSSPGKWAPFESILNVKKNNNNITGLAINSNGYNQACKPSCPPPTNADPIVLNWAENINSKYDNQGPYSYSPVCTSWMQQKNGNCTNKSYGNYIGNSAFVDEVSVISDLSITTTGITSLSTRLTAPVVNDTVVANRKKEFFDLNLIIRPFSSAPGLYEIQVVLTNHADPTITYSRTELLADTP